MSESERRPLLERFPELKRSVPWLRIARLPTPVTEEAELGRALGCPQPLWIKHDERTGEPYGGNKVRKLEYLIAAAEQAGVERWIVYGPLGSNWVLATCVYGRQRGAKVEAILFRRPLHEQARRNFSIDRELADRVRVVPHVSLVPLAVAWARWRAKDRTTVLPPGGTSPLSTLGYVNAGLELAEQVRVGELPEPGAVIVAGGTGGTVAGLWIGLRLAGLSSRVVPVRVADTIVSNRWVRTRIVRQTLDFMRSHGATFELEPPKPRELASVRGFLAPGYGKPSPAGEEVAELARRDTGLRLDPTYTAKALAGLRHWAAEHPESGPVLFWNTYHSQTLDGLAERFGEKLAGR